MFSCNSFGIVVCGSNGFKNYPLFTEKLDHLLSEIPQWDIHIITGDAKGVDEMARRYAEDRGYELHTFAAWWEVYGKDGAKKRNESMFQFLIKNFSHPACFAMWDGVSKGTRYSINFAKKYSIPLRICNLGKKNVEPLQPEEPEYGTAPKWFQDDPELSNYDKFLIKSMFENVPKNRDERDEARSRTIYIEESEYARKKRRARLLERAARLADAYGVWATPSWYEEVNYEEA